MATQTEIPFWLSQTLAELAEWNFTIVSIQKEDAGR